MTRNVNINSLEWCDIIFEGKNKEYGAYAMRLSSSKRHIVAFGCVVLLMAMVMAMPKIMNAIKPAAIQTTYSDGFVLSGLPIELPEDKQIIETKLTPPPPALIRSIIYNPPVITPDDEVADKNAMRSIEELNEFGGAIGNVTVDTENRRGELAEPNMTIPIDPPAVETPVIHCEQMPVFPGGTSELMSYLQKNLRYPQMAIDVGIEGRVILKFVVSKTGGISDVQVVKGIDPSCDREAVRVVSSMPNWIPGAQNGNPVAVYFTLPVVFRLHR
jgi:protein TonB